jgi:hypothetical protein
MENHQAAQFAENPLKVKSLKRKRKNLKVSLKDKYLLICLVIRMLFSHKNLIFFQFPPNFDLKKNSALIEHTQKKFVDESSKTMFYIKW